MNGCVYILSDHTDKSMQHLSVQETPNFRTGENTKGRKI